MTVCVTIKVHDCIVFSADSATSLSVLNGDGALTIANIYANGNKLFNLHKGLPIAAMTAGIGNFGHSSISTISKDFRLLLTEPGSDYTLDRDNYTIEEVATKAKKYFFETRFSAAKPQPEGSFDFWIGGYSSDEELGEVWRIHISDGNSPDPICEASRELSCNISWGGQPEAINRLILGYGQKLPEALLEAGLPDDQLKKMLSHIAAKSQAQLINPAMPTMDAIDLASYLVQLTTDFVRFLPGANTVGGAIDIATITKHEGFKWVQRKHYYPTKLNPLETDHA